MHKWPVTRKTLSFDDVIMCFKQKQMSWSAGSVTIQWRQIRVNSREFFSRVIKQVNDLKVSVDEHGIEFSKSSLGICIDDTLTFDSHMNHICWKGKPSNKCFTMTHEFNGLSQQKSNMQYIVLFLHTLIIAHLYGFPQSGLLYVI